MCPCSCTIEETKPYEGCKRHEVKQTLTGLCGLHAQHERDSVKYLSERCDTSQKELIETNAKLVRALEDLEAYRLAFKQLKGK
jgi:DNA polymerase III epsilon subunit-like protein